MAKRVRLRSRRWLWAFGLTVLCLLAGLFAINFHYDPYSIFSPSDALPTEANGIRNVLSSYSYVTKAAQIAREKPGYVMLGTSVTDGGFRLPGAMVNGYNPDPEAALRLWRSLAPHPAIYNAALRGKHIHEIYEYFRHIYVNNPNLKEVYLGIDWTMFSAGGEDSLASSVSILGKTHVTLDYLLQYSLSWDAAGHSWDMWKVAHGDIVQKYGAFLHHFPLQLISSAFAESDAPPSLSPKPGQNVNRVLKDDYEFQTHSFIFTAWFIEGLKLAIGSKKPSDMPYAGFDSLKKIVTYCRGHHILLKVFITPKHPLYYAFMDHFGMSAYPDDWLRRVTQITPVWDFSGAIDFGPTPDKYYALDSLHFIPAGGELILPELLHDKPTLPGVHIVTPQNVDQVIAENHQGYAAWQKLHPALSKSVLAVSEEQAAGQLKSGIGNHIPLMPVMYEPDYKGYRVFKLMGQFIAVPATQADSLTLNDAMQYQDHHWPAAESLEKLLALLPSKKPDGKRYAGKAT